jgi:hypothetical protein
LVPGSFIFPTRRPKPWTRNKRLLLEVVYEALEDAGMISLSMTLIAPSPRSTLAVSPNDYNAMMATDLRYYPKYTSLVPEMSFSRSRYDAESTTLDEACQVLIQEEMGKLNLGILD